MTQQNPSSSAPDAQNIPFYKRMFNPFRREPATLPKLNRDEYREIMEVDDVCQRLEEALQAQDRERFQHLSEELKKMIHEVVIPRRENIGRVHEDEKLELAQFLTGYLSALESGQPGMRQDFLNAVFGFIRRGHPEVADQDPVDLDTHTLLQVLRSRESVAETYRDELIRVQQKSRKRLYGVLGAGVIALAAGASAWAFYDGKKDTQEQLEEKTEELKARENQLAQLSASSTIPAEMAALEQRVNQLRTERENLESQLESGRETLQQIQTQEQSMREREEQLLSLENNLQQKEDQLQAQEQRLQEREQEVSSQMQRLEDDQNQIQELEGRKNKLEAEIQTLQGVLEAEREEEVSPQIQLRAQMLREKARSGDPLTIEEIQVIREASEAMISQWREETALEIQQIQESVDQAEKNNTSTSLSRSMAASRISRLRQNLKSKTLLEQHQRESLIAIAGMRT
jgi:hypothetical protein